MTTTNVTNDACTATHKNVKWLLAILYGVMSLFLGLVGYAIAAEHTAVDAGHSAKAAARQVAVDLELHQARQNGTLESIQSQLGTLRTYYSNLRGDVREQTEVIRADVKDNREILDELLRHAGSHTIAKDE